MSLKRPRVSIFAALRPLPHTPPPFPEASGKLSSFPFFFSLFFPFPPLLFLVLSVEGFSWLPRGGGGWKRVWVLVWMHAWCIWCFHGKKNKKYTFSVPDAFFSQCRCPAATARTQIEDGIAWQYSTFCRLVLERFEKIKRRTVYMRCWRVWSIPTETHFLLYILICWKQLSLPDHRSNDDYKVPRMWVKEACGCIIRVAIEMGRCERLLDAKGFTSPAMLRQKCVLSGLYWLSGSDDILHFMQILWSVVMS